MKKVGIYARVSTDDQAAVAEGGTKNQVDGLKKWVEGENLKFDCKWGVIVDLYVDDGYSAKSLDRPEVKRLLRDVQRKRIDTVLMTEISRLSRSVRDWQDLQEFFDDHDADFIAIRQNFDTSNAMGKAMLNFGITFTQLEREQTVERTKYSYQQRLLRGLWPGGPLPFGLDRTDDAGRPKTNAAKQIIAVEICDILLNEAGSLRKAAQLIHEAGYTREGGKPWDEQSLARWIRSYALLGMNEVNRKNKDKDQSKLPESERYRLVKAVWEPILDEARWERANALLKRNYGRLKVAQWKYGDYLLSTLVQCPMGAKLTGAGGTSHTKRKYVYYQHQKKCSCHIKSVRAELVDTAVVKELKRIAKSPEVVKSLVEKANEEFVKKRPNFDEAIFTMERKLETIVRRIDQTMNQVLDAPSGTEKQMWVEKAQRLQAEKEQAEREIVGLREKKDGHRKGALNHDDVMAALEKFEQGFNDLPLASKMELIQSLVNRVIVEKNELLIEVKNPGVALMFDRNSDLSACVSGGQNFYQRIEWGDRPELNEIAALRSAFAYCRQHLLLSQ